MHWGYFFIGIVFFVVAYLIYRGIKRGPSSEKTNWKGPTLSLYVQGWGVVILCVLAGLVNMIKAF